MCVKDFTLKSRAFIILSAKEKAENTGQVKSLN